MNLSASRLPWLGDVAVFENRQPVTAAKFITKSSLFILLLGVIRLPKPKLSNEQKAENIFVAPPYCQTACCVQFFVRESLHFFGCSWFLKLTSSGKPHCSANFPFAILYIDVS
jgi:hypothetical protein